MKWHEKELGNFFIIVLFKLLQCRNCRTVKFMLDPFFEFQEEHTLTYM